MTAAELLRTALKKEHQKRLTLCPEGERFDLARELVMERDGFEEAMDEIRSMFTSGHNALRLSFDAAVFALAGVAHEWHT